MGVDIHEYKRVHGQADYNPAGAHYAGSAAILKDRWKAYAKARQRAKASSAREAEIRNYNAKS